MGILNVDHPDIEEFIFSKRETGVLNNFNISVGISDDFMQAAVINGEWRLIHPNTKETIKKVNAGKLWNDIVNSLADRRPRSDLGYYQCRQPHTSIGKLNLPIPAEKYCCLFEPCILVNQSFKIYHSKNGNHEIDWYNWKKWSECCSFLDDVIEVNNYIILR
jgi:ribonucleoside-diphosphate reductase alpha chain